MYNNTTDINVLNITLISKLVACVIMFTIAELKKYKNSKINSIDLKKYFDFIVLKFMF